MNDPPIHLLFPLSASLLFVCGLLTIKRATIAGVNPWTITFFANQWAALIFSFLWLLGGNEPAIEMLWQAAIVAVLYIAGQVFMFAAVQQGDVSVATPVFGLKVILVGALLTLVFHERLSVAMWIAAGFATLGIGLVQYSPRTSDGRRSGRGQIRNTIALALLSASSFACFDVLVQSWAPRWGTGKLLPTVYWLVGLLSLGLLPAVQWKSLSGSRVRKTVGLGTLLIALQALCLVYTLASFGDAARVNVVYALRAMWGVILAWFVAVLWGGNEALLPRKTMLARAIGAAILTTSVIIAVSS